MEVMEVGRRFHGKAAAWLATAVEAERAVKAGFFCFPKVSPPLNQIDNAEDNDITYPYNEGKYRKKI